MSVPATNARPFVLRTNTIFRTLGAIFLLLFALDFVVDLAKASKGVSSSPIGVEAVILLPLGLGLLSRRDRTVVDPGAGTVVRQTGFWPFVRSTPRPIADVAEIVKEAVRSEGLKGSQDLVRLQLRFTDGEVWDVHAENPPGTKVHAWAERLAAATGRPVVGS